MKSWRHLSMVGVTLVSLGCGEAKKAAPAPMAPPMAAPAPVAPPPAGAPPVAPTAPAAATTTQKKAPDAPWDPDTMLVAQPTPSMIAGHESTGLPGEKLIASVPTNNADLFYGQPPKSDARLNSSPFMGTATGASQKLPTGFKAIPEFGNDESGYPKRILCEKNQSEMILIPAGVFQMGSNNGPVETRPQHAMFIDAFYIDLYETNLEDFQAFRDDQKARKQRLPKEPLNANSNLKLPVLGVNFGDARGYAKWVGCDLPTEAEWEKAARGTEGYTYPWGEGRPAWTSQKGLAGIQLAGSEPTDISIYGVKDLAGNAREWCLDNFAVDAYPRLLADAKDVPRNWTGPRTPTNKSERTVKGNGPGWKLSHRAGVVMTDNINDIGFRCVLRFNEVD